MSKSEPGLLLNIEQIPAGHIEKVKVKLLSFVLINKRINFLKILNMELLILIKLNRELTMQSITKKSV